MTDRERLAALTGVAAEVVASVPATYESDDPMVARHAKALNALAATLESLEAGVTLAPRAPEGRSGVVMMPKPCPVCGGCEYLCADCGAGAAPGERTE